MIIEGDSNICFDSISNKYLFVDWSIAAPIVNICSLVKSFSSCAFNWVNRRCNGAAHAAAKLALVSSKPLCFNNSNLPTVLQRACKEDCPSVVFLF